MYVDFVGLPELIDVNVTPNAGEQTDVNIY